LEVKPVPVDVSKLDFLLQKSATAISRRNEKRSKASVGAIAVDPNQQPNQSGFNRSDTDSSDEAHSPLKQSDSAANVAAPKKILVFDMADGKIKEKFVA
jgi:hypothetical protein